MKDRWEQIVKRWTWGGKVGTAIKEHPWVSLWQCQLLHLESINVSWYPCPWHCASILGSYHLGKLSKVHQESQYYFLNSICNDPKVKASTKRKEASKQAGGSGLSKSGSVNNGHEPSHSISPSVKWGRMRLYPKPWWAECFRVAVDPQELLKQRLCKETGHPSKVGAWHL